MFKFDKYPILKEMHQKYLKNDFSTTQALINIVDKNKKGASEKFKKLRLKEDEFLAIYDKIVFDLFVITKPPLLNRRTNSFETWEDVFGLDFKNIPNGFKPNLGALIEEDGGLYRLPPEYYE